MNRVAGEVLDRVDRRVRAQQRGGRADRRAHGLREVERVLHVARGMLGGHVERFEVVVVVFDLWARVHVEARMAEDLDHGLGIERLQGRLDMLGLPHGKRALSRSDDQFFRGKRVHGQAKRLKKSMPDFNTGLADRILALPAVLRS